MNDEPTRASQTREYNTAVERNALAAKRVPALEAALEKARAGLLWYQDMHPADSSPADDEMMDEINAALRTEA